MKEIKASDLRIGNLVNYKYYNPDPKAPDWAYEAVEIVEIKQSHLVFKHLNKKARFKIAVLYAIPLTEEWLLRFGFEKQYNNWKRLSICNDWTYLYWERLAGVELSVNKRSCMLPHINYVHQLQNLFFSLCGEELTINN